MTASQTYSIQEEKESVVNLEQKQKRPKSLYEQIDSAILDLYCDIGKVETVGLLMLNAGLKCDSSDFGDLFKHFADLMDNRLRKVEKLVCSIKRSEDV